MPIKGNNITIEILVKLNASKNEIVFGKIITAYTTKVPEHNQVNLFIVKQLSKIFKTPQKNIFLKKGEKNKNKLFFIKNPKNIPKELKL